MAEFKISLTSNAENLKDSYEQVGEKFDAALKVAANMIASMVKTETVADIRSAGNFGDTFLEGLSVTADDKTITTKLDAPGAEIFAHGGTIHGHPLLWLPISGTDAVGIPASNYGDQLFSVNRKTGGPPLLFSVADRAPKYFGVPSVTIPQKFHIAEIQAKVMEKFPEVFEQALKEA